MQQSALTISNLSKSFNGIKALHQVDLTIDEGEFIALLGPSGCGKTTLLRLIAGLDEPDSGSIAIDGKEIVMTPAEHRPVNTVFQSYALFPHLNVFENVAFGLRCQHLPEAEITTRVESLLQLVRLSEYTNAKPASLSGGQQQRVAVARALVNRPKVLLLDEPFAALDYKLRQTMQLELKHLQRKVGITFVFVTHDQEEALSMADRVVVFNNGHIQQIGKPREVYEKPENLFVAQFIGDANVFHCPVTRCLPTHIEVELEGLTLLVDNDPKLKQAEKVHVIVRPEDIEVWGKNERQPFPRRLTGTIEEIIYKGSMVDVRVRLPNGKIIAAKEFFDEEDDSLEYEYGEKVWLEWPQGWEIVLEDEK